MTVFAQPGLFMSERKPDRRIARTKNMLWEALLALLQKHEWDDVNVQMICDEADVARSSFYVHFGNKAALLDHGFDREMTTLAARIAAHEAPAVQFAVLDWLASHVSANPGFMAKSLRARSGQALLSRFHDALCTALKLELGHKRLPVNPDKVTFVIGGCLSVLRSRAGFAAAGFDAAALAALFQSLGGALLHGSE